MYSNQFPSTDLQRFYGPQVPYHRAPDVVGEGDVIPINALDGSVQLYFVPMLRRHPYPLYPGVSGAYPLHATSEYWYIRSICNENPSTFMNYLLNTVHTANVSGSQVITNNLTTDTSYHCYGNQYFQKFHNDHSTSTTDIHYFYPSLRHGDQKLSLSVAVQTDFNAFMCCSCPHGFAVNPRNTNEEMCVDTVQGTKSRYTNVKYSDEKSNKLVANYADASSNCAEGIGRETQTAVRTMKRCDVIRIDEYVPRRKARRIRSESCSSDCSCTDLR